MTVRRRVMIADDHQIVRQGLRALLDVAGFTGDSAPNARQVAFQIAPRLNAAGRMDTAKAVVDDPAFAKTMDARGVDVDYRPGDKLRADLWREYKLHTEILRRIGLIKP